MLLAEAKRFLYSSAFIVVFAVASWLGFSRAEYLALQRVELILPTGTLSLELAPVLWQTNAIVFVDEEMNFYRISSPSFILRKPNQNKNIDLKAEGIDISS